MIRKDKVFELKIEEDDDVSGINSISLVDEPAIEVNWVAFAKEKFEKVSIDYDNTLSTDKGKELAKRLLAEGKDLSIVTRRQESDLGPVKAVAKELGIPESKVHATNGKLKWETIKKLGINKHIDNNSNELKAIKENLPHVETEQFDYNVGTIGGYVDPGITKKKPKIVEKSVSRPTLFADETAYLFGENTHSDYPDSVKNNAKAVLKYVDENGWGSCGTDVGKQRANQLAKGEALSMDTIKRMYSYLSRHAGDLESSKGYGDGCGKLMYDSWGGKSALSWAESKIRQEEKMSKQYFAQDEEKHMVLGPAMIPNQKIFRKDQNGNPYYVYFSPETIKMIASKYMKNKYTDNNDMMHDGEAVPDVYVVESWIKESNNDKSSDYGFSELPVGTWFVSMKINNPEIWAKVKEHQLNGFSVSGYFEEVAEFKREQAFLQKVADILSNIED
jgi:hypothetical protein